MRRLKLMNEVLPAPTTSSVGSPRERTLRHMRRLLAAAATAAIAPACHGYAVVDPLPSPPRCQGVAATIKANAAVTETGVIHVTLEPPTAAGTTYINEAPKETKNFALTEGRIEFDVAQTTTEIAIPVDCPRGRAALLITLHPPAKNLPEGVVVQVQVVDYE